MVGASESGMVQGDWGNGDVLSYQIRLQDREGGWTFSKISLHAKKKKKKKKKSVEDIHTYLELTVCHAELIS